MLAPQTERAQRDIARVFGVETPAEAADALESFIASLGVPMRLRDTESRCEDIPEVAEAVRDKIRRYREDPGGHDPGAAGVGLVARETTSAWRRTDRYGM